MRKLQTLNWLEYGGILAELLRSMVVTDRSGQVIAPDAAFKTLKEMTGRIHAGKKFMYFIGNGASASIASHMAADMGKNGHLHTAVFTDLALMTAIANDISYDEVFAEPIRRQTTPGDMLVAISSSGRSTNILNACRVALELSGTVITLSGMAADNPLRELGELNFYVAGETYGMVETCHAFILHFWMDHLNGDLKKLPNNEC